MLQIFLLPPPNYPTGTTQLAKNGKNSAIEMFFTIDLHDYLKALFSEFSPLSVLSAFVPFFAICTFIYFLI